MTNTRVHQLVARFDVEVRSHHDSIKHRQQRTSNCLEWWYTVFIYVCTRSKAVAAAHPGAASSFASERCRSRTSASEVPPHHRSLLVLRHRLQANEIAMLQFSGADGAALKHSGTCFPTFFAVLIVFTMLHATVFRNRLSCFAFF